MTRKLATPTVWHPLPLAAVVVLVVNDHLLKGSGLLPGWITGKLSDVAGLFFFPILIAALWGRVVPTPTRVLATGAAAITAAAFALVKLVPPINAWVGAWWGPMVMDPTDLAALPSVGLGALWMLRTTSRPWGRVREAVAMLAAAASSMATSPMRNPCVGQTQGDPPMAWSATCVRTEGFQVVLEGRHASVKLPLEATSADAPCELTIGITLEYEVTDAHVTVDLRAPDVPATIQGRSAIEAAADLPYPTTCAAVKLHATTFPRQPPAGDHDPRYAAPPHSPVRRASLPAPITTCEAKEAR